MFKANKNGEGGAGVNDSFIANEKRAKEMT